MRITKYKKKNERCTLGTSGSRDENENGVTVWLAYLGFATMCSCELDRDSVTVTSCLTLHYGIVVITRD